MRVEQLIRFKELEPHYRATDSYHRAPDPLGQRDPYAHIYLEMGQFPNAPRYGHPIYQRDPLQRMPMYAERPPVERHIKLDIPDYYDTMDTEKFLDCPTSCDCFYSWHQLSSGRMVQFTIVKLKGPTYMWQ